MTLISMGIIVAFGTSLAGTSGLFELEVCWELASLITIMILGHWLEIPFPLFGPPCGNEPVRFLFT